MVSLRSNLLRAVAENTALVISVMEFGSSRRDMSLIIYLPLFVNVYLGPTRVDWRAPDLSRHPCTPA